MRRPANGPRVLVVPEYYWAGHNIVTAIPGVTPLRNTRKVGTTMVSTVTNDKKKEIYRGLKAISQRAGDLVLVAGSVFYEKTGGGRQQAYNVCPVLRYGEVILKDYKVYDDGFAGANDLIFAYKNSRPYFDVDGVGFGLEICGEHIDDFDTGARIHHGGRLRKWAASTSASNSSSSSASNTSSPIHIHIVIGEGSVLTKESAAARADGYVVFCDSLDGHAFVQPAGRKFVISERLKSSMAPVPQVNGTELHTFVLTV